LVVRSQVALPTPTVSHQRGFIEWLNWFHCEIEGGVVVVVVHGWVAHCEVKVSLKLEGSILLKALSAFQSIGGVPGVAFSSSAE